MKTKIGFYLSTFVLTGSLACITACTSHGDSPNSPPATGVSPSNTAGDDQGGAHGGGGNELAIKFINATSKAIGDVLNQQKLFPEYVTQTDKINNILDKLTRNTVVSKSSIFVQDGDTLQECTAKSTMKISGDFQIELNGNPDSKMSIDKIGDNKILATLGIHEVNVLLGIEKTGDYHLSQKYLSSLGIVCETGICAPDPSGFETVYLTADAERKYFLPAENKVVFVNPVFKASAPLEVDTAETATTFPIFGGYQNAIDNTSAEAYCALFGYTFNDAPDETVKDGLLAFEIFNKDKNQWQARNKMSPTSTDAEGCTPPVNDQWSTVDPRCYQRAYQKTMIVCNSPTATKNP